MVLGFLGSFRPVTLTLACLPQGFNRVYDAPMLSTGVGFSSSAHNYLGMMVSGLNLSNLLQWGRYFQPAVAGEPRKFAILNDFVAFFRQFRKNLELDEDAEPLEHFDNMASTYLGAHGTANM